MNEQNQDASNNAAVYFASTATPKTTRKGATSTTQLIEFLRSHDWDGVISHLSTDDGQRDVRTRSNNVEFWDIYYDEDDSNDTGDTDDGMSGFYPIFDVSCAREAPNYVIIAMVNAFPDALLLDYRLVVETETAANKRRSNNNINGLARMFQLKDYVLNSKLMEVMIKSTKGKCLSTTESDTGGIFLHRVCKLSKSSKLLQLVLDHYPEGVSTCDLKGKLPIHYLCEYGSEYKSVKSMIRIVHEQYPCGIRTIDKLGNTPLHYACKNEKLCSTSKKLLLEVHPTATEVINLKGQTPLHMLCQSEQYDPRFLLQIVSQNPKYLLLRDKNGMTPYDLAKDTYRQLVLGNSSTSRGNDVLDIIDHLEHVLQILIYATYRYCILFKSQEEEEDTIISLDIEHFKPRSQREQLLCLAFTAHMNHSNDFKSWLLKFYSSWSEEEEDNNTNNNGIFNSNTSNDHEEKLTTTQEQIQKVWLPSIYTQSKYKNNDEVSIQDDEYMNGNTPLHLLWNELLSSRYLCNCTHSQRSFIHEDINHGSMLNIIDLASEIDFSSNSSSSSNNDDYDDNSFDTSDSGSGNSEFLTNDVDLKVDEEGSNITYPLTHAKVLLDELLSTNEQRFMVVSHCNDIGELPLHRLLKFGTPNVADMNNVYYDTCYLLNIYPESCFVIDPITNLYPFMLAAAAITTTEVCTITSSLQEGLCDNKNDENNNIKNNNNKKKVYSNNYEPYCVSTILYLLKRFVAERPLISN